MEEGPQLVGDEIEGFHLYLSVAEGDELELASAPRKTPGLYETCLPFALALGDDNELATGVTDH